MAKTPSVGKKAVKTSANKVASKKVAGKKVAGKKVAGKKVAGKKVAGEKVAGEKVAGEKVAGEKVAGKKVAGKKVAGEKVAGEKVAGKKLAGKSGKRSAMEFIAIRDNNHKENESFIHFCQWTGNEVELEKLMAVIDEADPRKLDGDYSDLECRKTIIPEEIVDANVSLLTFGNYSHMFQKHVGVFKCPDFSKENSRDSHLPLSYQLARKLNSYFCACQMGNYFK